MMEANYEKGSLAFGDCFLMALGWAGWSSQAQTSSRITWEYKVVTAGGHRSLNLNELGSQGWELITIERDESASSTTRTVINNYYFKRPK